MISQLDLKMTPKEKQTSLQKYGLHKRRGDPTSELNFQLETHREVEVGLFGDF